LGLTYIEVDISNPRTPRKTARLRFLVDSGAINSVAPATVLRRLGIKPTSTRKFTLADGTGIERQMGEVSFRINGHSGTSPVIFGKKEDSALLGSVSLEVLGLFLDPLKRELRSLPMMLAGSGFSAW
jgi:clan AA aspartic protease